MTSPGLSARVLLLACVALAGCVTVDAVLSPDGSATVDMTYQLPPDVQEAQEKARHTSAHVAVESLKFSADRETVTLKAKVDDVTKLSTAEGFKDVTVTRSREGADERLTITITNRRTIVMKGEGQPGPTLTITFPGAVKDANRGGTVRNNKVTWSFTLPEFVKEKSVELTARYAAPAEQKDAPKDTGERKDSKTKGDSKAAPTRK